MTLSSLLVSLALTATRSPEPWLERFAVRFASNVSWSHPPSFENAVPGQLKYDWNLRAQRIEHAAGAVECQKFYGTPLPCVLLTNAKGLYRMLSQPLPPGQPACCLDMQTIHTPPPSWAAKADPVDAGLVAMEMWPVGNLSTQTQCWEYPATGICSPLNRTSASDSGCHSYYELDGGSGHGAPALFTFPAAGGLQDWYFDARTMSTHALPSSIFEVPRDCVDRKCPKPLSTGARGVPGA